MATYEELFNQLNSQIDLATENNQLAEACTKLTELINLYLDLGFDLMGTMNYSEASNNFNTAGEEIFLFRRYYQEIIDNKMFEEDSDELKKLKVLSDDNEVSLLTSAAYLNFCSALFNSLNRNPGAAGSYYGKSEKSFNDLADKTGNISFKVLANYCNALIYYAEAIEDFYRASFANAKTKCQRAKILLEKVIEKDLEPLKENEEYKDFYNNSVNLFKSDYQSIKSYYFISDAKYQFNNRNFKNAVKQFSNVVAEFDFSIKNYFNAAENENLKNLMLGEYHNYSGWKLLSQAEVYRESADWEQAFSNYELVKSEWEDASGFYLQSGLPSAAALQEAVLNSATNIDVYQAVCENEKELNEKVSSLQKEIDELKDKLFNAIKPMGITVNNTQDVVTTVEQNAQFIQNIENNAREGIKELLETVNTSNLDESAKKKIETTGKEVLESKEKGHKFLDKVKSFTKDVGEIIKNVGDIAMPLISAFKFLSFLI